MGAKPMAAFQICLQVWMASSLLADGLAVAGQTYTIAIAIAIESVSDSSDEVCSIAISISSDCANRGWGWVYWLQLSGHVQEKKGLEMCSSDSAGNGAQVRPPGHHAGVKQAMGFCLHNNAAIAAFAAQAAGANSVLLSSDQWYSRHMGTVWSFDQFCCPQRASLCSQKAESGAPDQVQNPGSFWSRKDCVQNLQFGGCFVMKGLCTEGWQKVSKHEPDGQVIIAEFESFRIKKCFPHAAVAAPQTSKNCILPHRGKTVHNQQKTGSKAKGTQLCEHHKGKNEEIKNTNLVMIKIHDNDELEIPSEELVSKVEYLFSTCTQKVKNRMLTQETLDRDQ
ncbi:hypothetical protein LXL04_033957 [Taraxacum kok-saghyz]